MENLESAGGSRRFPTTLWSTILRARGKDTPGRRAALEKLAKAYWRPARRYVRAIRGRGDEDAEEITQDFFTRLLERDPWDRLSPERGSFRGFLKQAIRNFIRDVARSEAARRRAEHGAMERAKEQEAEVEFDRSWDQAVLLAATAELGRRLKEAGREVDLEVFRRYCGPRGEGAGPRYRDVGEALGLTEDAVRKKLARCRAALREILRETVREYAADEREAETEYRRIARE